jgi:uncharacterized protein YndB with AHSA1/START domain
METEITRHVTLDTDPADAWDLLTRAEDLEQWLGTEVVFDPTPGAAGSVVDHDGTHRRLVVDEVVPGQRLSWRWWDERDGGAGEASRVEISITPSDSGALVTVIERPLPGPVPQSVVARAHATALAAADAWSHRLLQLEAVLLFAAVRG